MTDMVTRVAQRLSMKLYGGYPVGTNHSREIMAQWENTKALAAEVVEEMEKDFSGREEAAFERGRDAEHEAQRS